MDNKTTIFAMWFGRISIFTIYFWFGILKVLHLSPANPLVQQLLESTMPFWSFDSFIIFFGYLEMLIGLTFLFPKFLKTSFVLLILHLITTAMPMFLLPTTVWQSTLVPTLEGQYIIKNLLLISVALFLFIHRNDASTSYATKTFPK